MKSVRNATGNAIDPTRLSASTLNLTRLRYFVAVAQELHFGRAAARLGLSQPPLTMHIQALEQQIGTQLFSRTKRKVSLTVSGRILLAHATQLLDHAERVTHVMQGVSTGELGNLFLGCVPFALFHVLPSIARRFRELHPGINIVLSEGHTTDVIKGVSEGRLDVGLVWKNLDAPELGDLPVLECRFVAALQEGHRLAAAKRVSLEDLAAEPLILPSRKISPYHYDQVLASFAQRGLVPQIAYEVPMILSQIGFAASGFGIALTPSVARRFSSIGVTFREIDVVMAPVLLSLVWSKQRESDSVVRLREVVRELQGTHAA